ncbi:Fc.00g064980.m01.CDS01 [Cosmosporella sp. VM-42]
MPRKLVTVRRITALNPIPGADRIQTATVDGWTCVVAVGDFQVDDFGLYFEIDSVLPISDPRWAFLAAKFSKPEDIRIKTMKIRKVMSQGLLMPLSKFPEVQNTLFHLEQLLGTTGMEKQLRDRSFEDELGVRKYEKLVPEFKSSGSNTLLADFPDFIPKTDQERVQNLPEVFDEWKNATFQETTKMDGSSMTVYFIRSDSPNYAFLPPLPEGSTSSKLSNGRVGVCSRNRDLGDNIKSMSLFWAAAKVNNLPETLNNLNRNIAIQGELCGSSIQGNFEGFGKGIHDFYLYSIWDIDAQRHLPPREVHETWAPKLSVKHVPVVGYRPLYEIAGSMAELLARADGTGINGRKREGIVLKHMDGAFSFKAISNSYLLKHGE